MSPPDGTIREQLEAYARDLRQLFVDEKRKSHELTQALAELRATYRATVRGFAAAVEAKDEYTAGHLTRVTAYGLLMLRSMAPDLIGDPQYEYGFVLHDVGKLVVPDEILTKRGPLTAEEWSIMRRHPEIGHNILDGIPFLNDAKNIVCTHHERWDGHGYPAGMRNDDIPLGGRIFPIADSFDAMTSDRPYRSAMSIHAAYQELKQGAGSQFWGEAVDAFLAIPVEDLEAIMSGPVDWTPLD